MLKIISDTKLNKLELNTIRSGVEVSLIKRDYTLLDKSVQDEAINTQVKDECLDDSCLIDTGKMLAATHLIILNINKQKNHHGYLFNIKSISLETSETIRSRSETYDRALTDITFLLSFSKRLANSLFELDQTDIIFKSYLISELTGAEELVYFGSGVGAEFLDISFGRHRLMLLGTNFLYNITDKNFYIDLYTEYKFQLFDKINIGLNASAILTESFKTATFSILAEYTYLINKNFFIKAKLKSGVSHYKNTNYSFPFRYFITSNIYFGINIF